MEHEEIQQHFSDYWERSLDDATRKVVEDHLTGCEVCRAEYGTFEKAMEPLGKLHRVPAPDMKESVPALINRRSRGRFFGPRSQRLRLLEWASLVTLGVIAAVYLILKLSHPSVLLH